MEPGGFSCSDHRDTTAPQDGDFNSAECHCSIVLIRTVDRQGNLGYMGDKISSHNY